jgi:long-chain fatty acid transport protein
LRSLHGRFLLLIAVAILLSTTSAFGSGFALFEQGAKATAMGGAFAATADDPSAIFYNVAGIAQLRHTEFLAGGTLINFNNQFTGDPNDIFSAGTTGKYRAHTFIPPNAYLVVPFAKNATFGIGVMTPFGLRTNWENPWVGRFVSKDANIKVVSVQPSLAWQTSDARFAIGGGLEYRRAKVELSRNAVLPNVNPFTGRFPDVASTFLVSDWTNKWGWNAGIIFRPGTWRIGLSHRAKMDMDFDGNVKVTQISTGNPAVDQQVAGLLPPSQPINTTLNFPAFTHFGIATSSIPTWDIEFDIVHTTWSDFKDLTVNFETTPGFSFTRVQNWKNADSYRLGGNKKVTDDWDIRLGALYDKNPQPVEAVSPLLPDSDRVGVTFGVGWHRGPWVVDATEFVLHFKERSTQGKADLQTNINGTYNTDANLFSLNLGYKF